MHADQDGKKVCKLYQPSLSRGKLPSMAGTMQGEREKQHGLRDQGGLQTVSIMLSSRQNLGQKDDA